MHQAVHFIGFKDDRILAAIRVWGKPDFYHRKWDQRAKDEICEGDTAVFASGDEAKAIDPYTWDDSSRF